MIDVWSNIKYHFTPSRARADRYWRRYGAKIHLDMWVDYGDEDELALAIKILRGLDSKPGA